MEAKKFTKKPVEIEAYQWKPDKGLFPNWLLLAIETGEKKEEDTIKECVYPNCGCAEARLCMAESGANDASFAVNLPHGKRN